MKLTNKILLAFLILMFLSFVAFRLVLHYNAELVPAAYDKGVEQKTIGLSKFSSLEINGRYYVHVVKSGYDSLKISGPDNLVNKYTSIENNEKTLIISSKVDLTKYFQPAIEIWIYSTSAESINVKNSAIVGMENFSGTQFGFAAEDSSIINCEASDFENCSFTLKDRSVISLNKTKNAIVDLHDSATLFLTINKGNIDGITSDKAELLLTGETMNNSVKKEKNRDGGMK